ncbi:hypothetical protein AB4Z14_03150 [Terrabacter sp. 2TAF16]|uniref:hypothetical protein n=1 Tax=Terrabacter sp. 2TAF16 TaxID=3233008 RepID=UPI003F9A3B47
MSSLRRRRAGMPGVAVVVPAILAVASLLASCGATDIPTPRRTVTVTVDAPSTAPAGTPAATTTQVATSAPTSTDVPTALAVGRLRGAPRSFDEAKARLDAARPAASVSDRFRSPSGNIVCRRSTDSGLAACEVEKGRIDPPLPSICPAGGPSDIGRIELGPKGALPVCNSDTIRTGGDPELGYGSRTPPSGTTACLSESFGVTCIDESSRHGFFLARDTFTTF